MVLLYTDPRFRLHETGAHPECAERLRAIDTMLSETGLRERFAAGVCRSATDAELIRVHAPAHVAEIERFAAGGGGRIEVDTMVSRESAAVARLAAGTACDAVDAVVGGLHRQALVLCRPPGHHALPHAPMGFCLYNSIAIAAEHARAVHGLERVLIVDWDVHHGNGTQDVFYADAGVTFFSAHRWPFYPGTGDKSERGTGPGLGTTFNLPLPYGITRKNYLASFTAMLTEAADRCRPQLVLISAGFDAHVTDPVGSLSLESEDFAELTRFVLSVAKTHCDGKVVSLLEGGYNPPALAESVRVHLEALLQSPVTSGV
jgi:acetoin utilization deacetylase AcuC-like enzyme